jgi:hypothetical protein
MKDSPCTLAEWLLNTCPEASWTHVTCTGHTLRRRRWWHFSYPKDVDWFFEAHGTCAMGDVKARMGVHIGSTDIAVATAWVEETAATIRDRIEPPDEETAS